MNYFVFEYSHSEGQKIISGSGYQITENKFSFVDAVWWIRNAILKKPSAQVYIFDVKEIPEVQYNKL